MTLYKMDINSVYLVVTFAVAANAMCATESQDVKAVTGSNATFRFSKGNEFSDTFELSFLHGNKTIIGYIDYISNYTGIYHIAPSYKNRFILHGYMMRPYYPDWNITITLLNVSQEDAGQYELRGIPETFTNASFCLYVLSFPEVYISNLSKNEIYVLEGGDLRISGRPATILPSNSHYVVKMKWFLNDQELLPENPFTVRDGLLSIRPVPVVLHGSNLTYQATVAGYEPSTSVTTRIFVVYLSAIDAMLHPRQTLYNVKEGYFIPDIVCKFIFSQPTRITWTHRDKVVSNGSVLSLGRVERTMSGEYTCSVIVMSTGMRKEKSIYVIVDEVHEKPSAVSTIILSTIIGLIVAALIAMGILLCRNTRQKQGTQINQQETVNERNVEMNAYTMLQRESREQQLYDVADRSVTMEPPAVLPIEPRIYENQCVP